MLTEALVPGTDDWYLTQITNEMGAGFPRLAMLESYDNGTFVVDTQADPAVREAYQRFAARARLTFGATIVDQTVGRMNLRGFRTAAEDDVNGDPQADRLMRLNHFTRQFREMQRKKTLHGKAYLVVGHDDLGEPFITVRDMWKVGVRTNALRPWIVDAAVIISRDDIEQLDILTLIRRSDNGEPYMRVAVKESEQSTIPNDGTVWSPGLEWDWAASAPLPFDRVPVVQFTNPDGLGEFEKHTDSLDRITEDILERLTITAMQAFKQRAIETGEEGLPEYYPEGHEQAGEKIDYDQIYKGGPAALWLLPKGAKIWESAPINPSLLTEPEKKDIEHLAGISATPLYSLNPNVEAAAEGSKLQRETIRTKIVDRRQLDDEALATAMSLMFQGYGDQSRADPAEITTIWGPIEYVAKADVSQSAMYAAQAGKSQRFIDEFIYELTPDQMEMEAANLRDEQFQASLLGVTGSGANTGGTGPARSAEASPSDNANQSVAGPVGEL